MYIYYIYIYILCIYTLSTSLSLGQTTFFFFSFPFLPYDEFVLKGIFSTNKGLDASSFPWGVGGAVPWGKLHSERQSGCDPLMCVLLGHRCTRWLSPTMFVTVLAVSWSLVEATLGLLKRKRAWYLAFRWAQHGQGNNKTVNGWTDFPCSVNKTWLFCCVFDVGVEGFFKVKLRGSRQSDFFWFCLASLEW